MLRVLRDDKRIEREFFPARQLVSMLRQLSEYGITVGFENRLDDALTIWNICIQSCRRRQC
jgi:hypothetical protein